MEMKINFLYYLAYMVRKSITHRGEYCFLFPRCYISLFPVPKRMASPILVVSNLNTKLFQRINVGTARNKIMKRNQRNQISPPPNPVPSLSLPPSLINIEFPRPSTLFTLLFTNVARFGECRWADRYYNKIGGWRRQNRGTRLLLLY